MSRLRELLRDGDPVAGEPPLPDAEVRRMRRRIVATGLPRERQFAVGRRTLLASASLVLAVAATGVVSWMGAPARESGADGPANDAKVEQPVTRQLIFETPGGTRVIWVFNPEFRE
jgi:hypothetical protein